MLIDWITAKIDECFLSESQMNQLRKLGDRIARFSGDTGEMIYETQAWDTIRSDTHGLTIRMSSDSFWVQGSPARVMGSGCAVFEMLEYQLKAQNPRDELSIRRAKGTKGRS